MGGVGLHFRYVVDARPLCAGAGTLVSDSPLDTFLFPGSHKSDKQKQMQHEWAPMTVSIVGRGHNKSCGWMGVDRQLAEKVRIDIPTMRQMNESRIVHAS